MTPKERVLTALNFQEPDRIPIDLGGYVTGITKEAYRNLCDYLDINEPISTLDVVQQLTYPDEEVLQPLGVDTRYLFTTDGSAEEDKVKETPEGKIYVDGWGVTRKLSTDGLYFDITDSPLAAASIDELRRYPFPEVANQRDDIAGEVSNFTRAYGDSNFALTTQIFGSVFELSWYMRGFEQFLKDLYQNREVAGLLMDKVVEYWLDFFEVLFDEAGDLLDVIMVGDDLAIQHSLLINPEIYRELVKPRHQRIYDYIKNNSSAFICYHTCGAIRPLIPDLAEIGVDALNPVQVSAAGMDTGGLKRDFGDLITFWGGGVDTQRVFPQGTTDDVDREVKQRIDDLAPGGGFVFNPVHNIQADVPPENILNAYRVARSYGREVYD
ncbi:hypothetical protein KGY64_01230 [Candidatus Bipolaricaulota bacterium]|nr:hypothetical protein [Candidatus Bipolaricaulota bacterium]